MKFLTPILKWIAQVFLLPLFLDLIKSIQESIQEKREREKAKKDLEESVKKIENAATPEEQENALDEFTRKVRARRSST